MRLWAFVLLCWLPFHWSFRSVSRAVNFKFSHDQDNRFNTRSTALNGIPKLFRWLVDLYPIVLESVGEGLNSNQAVSIDNFYLDMNGIIHTCTHSNNDKLIELDEKAMFQRIFAYTDRLYKLVRPSRLMFLAVDGVAPRAKMNQQRSRRFRSSKEREVLLAEFVAKEGQLPENESFDSNCITPGTEFMYRLGIAFRGWIKYKMETDPFWQSGAEVVFSGPDVPGEGEHKVMDMIRLEQEKEKGNKNQFRHCMYGLDADLIMLSLVTHEPFFVLLREKISKRKQNKDAMSYSPEDFELLEISILRKMLNQHFKKLGEEMNEKSARLLAENNTKEKGIARFDIERVIDDFVFMCFFVGNDFLPCVPHLDIADGSLNLMMNIYRDIMPKLGGYLTNKDQLHLPRIELFLQEIARREPLYFQQRAIDEKDELYAGDDYRAHYYKVKFDINPGDEEAISKVVQSYLEGLAWVLRYYHKGCGSWTWYYPYLYAPLATDMIKLVKYPIGFDQGEPFTPLLQLLSVLPPQSGNFLPPSYESLMTTSTSPLNEYYPKDFEVDANGKKNAWECIVKIPFINEKILLDAVSGIDHQASLTPSEKSRNILGNEHRFLPIKKAESGVVNRGNIDQRWGNALRDNAFPPTQSGANNKPYRKRS